MHSKIWNSKTSREDTLHCHMEPIEHFLMLLVTHETPQREPVAPSNFRSLLSNSCAILNPKLSPPATSSLFVRFLTFVSSLQPSHSSLPALIPLVHSLLQSRSRLRRSRSPHATSFFSLVHASIHFCFVGRCYYLFLPALFA